MSKKQTTLDDLARMVKQGFDDTSSKEEVRGLSEATKQEIRNLHERIDRSEKNIIRRVDSLEFKISSYASGWTKDFENLHSWIQEIDERLTSFEKKSTIKSGK
jgi:uncharacterized protein YPO0396